MPIVVTTTSGTAPGITTTVQNIIDATAQDLQQLSPLLQIDYTNRVHQYLLRFSRWQFLLSPVERFVTELEQTDYWVGTSGSNPVTALDTGLNLTDFDIVREDSVFDRSNFRPLKRTMIQPITGTLSLADATMRPGKPAQFRVDPQSTNVINIYPAPDNQNTYQPFPPAPIVTTSVSGALAARTYYVRTTFVDSLGNESKASDSATKIYIPANSVAVVAAPQPGITKGTSGVKYDRYNVYAIQSTSTTDPGGELLQNGATPISINANWTEPNTGLVTGTAVFPSSNNITTIDGYIIEFRYYKARKILTLATDVLQVPDNYKDVMVAGVNRLTATYLGQDAKVAFWHSVWQDGITSILRDKNLFPKGGDYISPDYAGVGTKLPATEILNDPSFELF